MKYSSNIVDPAVSRGVDAVREHAAQTAREWLDADPLFLDTETTGLNGHIVEVAVLDRDGAVRLETLVQPRAPIEAGATALHGITQAMVADAPFFEQVWLRLRDLIRGRTVVVYNADFDRWRLIDSARDAGSTTFVETLAFAGPRGFLERSSNDLLPAWRCAMRGHVFICTCGRGSDDSALPLATHQRRSLGRCRCGALHAQRAAHDGFGVPSASRLALDTAVCPRCFGTGYEDDLRLLAIADRLDRAASDSQSTRQAR